MSRDITLRISFSQSGFRKPDPFAEAVDNPPSKYSSPGGSKIEKNPADARRTISGRSQRLSLPHLEG